MENTNLDTVLEEVADEVETFVPADNSSFAKNGLIVSGVVAGAVGLAILGKKVIVPGVKKLLSKRKNSEDVVDIDSDKDTEK